MFCRVESGFFQFMDVVAPPIVTVILRLFVAYNAQYPDGGIRSIRFLHLRYTHLVGRYIMITCEKDGKRVMIRLKEAEYLLEI